jgi:hypothetical protein
MPRKSNRENNVGNCRMSVNYKVIIGRIGVEARLDFDGVRIEIRETLANEILYRR